MKDRLVPLALAFLKLGFTAFGGPVAAYAMMREEFVIRRKWLSEDGFFDFLGVANLVPGPNATELAILIGNHVAGWRGFIVAGICYIFPAMLTVLGLAWIYVQFGTLPALEGVLFGIKPVVVAILLAGTWGILKPRIRNFAGLAIAFAAGLAYLAGVSPFLLLVAGGLILGIYRFIQQSTLPPSLTLLLLALPVWLAEPTAQSVPFSLGRLFWVFLKAGAMMLGSGYVLLAFIHDDLVVRLGWLTEAEMIDAIAVGQVTPGPLSSTATFVGYVMGGLPAAVLASLAMFIPSFIFIGIVARLVEKIRANKHYEGVIEGVNFTALGLMAGVTWEISTTAIVDPITGGIAALSLLLLLVARLSSPWLILGGAVIGLAKMLLAG